MLGRCSGEWKYCNARQQPDVARGEAFVNCGSVCCQHYSNICEIAGVNFNPLKTKRICFIYGLSAYRAVNTLHLGYKNQSLNVL
jgi:hypothetical protein